MRREDFQNQDTRPTYEQLYNNFRLCSDHFEDSQFTNPDKKRLVWNAVPTLFYVSNCPHPMTGKHLLPQERSKPPFKKAKCSGELSGLRNQPLHSIRFKNEDNKDLFDLLSLLLINNLSLSFSLSLSLAHSACLNVCACMCMHVRERGGGEEWVFV